MVDERESWFVKTGSKKNPLRRTSDGFSALVALASVVRTPHDVANSTPFVETCLARSSQQRWSGLALVGQPSTARTQHRVTSGGGLL